MPRILGSARPLALLAATVGALAACDDDSPTGSSSIAGTYRSTTFRATPTGQGAIDVGAAGGTLTIAIASDNSTTGTLSIPASVAGGQPVSASMAGTVRRTGNTLRFQQSADTFVRDLAWTVSGNTLQVTDQTAGSARFTIILTRQ